MNHLDEAQTDQAIDTGRSTPRLIADLLDYDPRRRGINPRSNASILADDPPRFVDQEIIRTGPLDCHHNLLRKDSQTSKPPKDHKFEPGEVWCSGSYCVNCKQHFTVTARYGDFEQCCNLHDAGNPLHHLIFNGQQQIPEADRTNENGDPKHNVVEEYQYYCSGHSCNLQVEVKIGHSRLLPKYFSTVLDAAKTVARGQKQIDAEPTRYQGAVPVRPLQALSYIWTYIKNAKASSEMLQVPKRIAVRNKKFLLAFGEDSGAMLEYLGFEMIEEVTENVEVSTGD